MAYKVVICQTRQRIMDANFSARAKDVLTFSREEALRLGNDYLV
jgi:hypothetical protein